MTKLNHDASPSAYGVRMSEQAEKGLKQLRPERLADTAMSFIWNDLPSDPTEYGDYGRKLHGALTGKYSAKRKKFRIVYRITSNPDMIEILEIHPR
ncbi:type II toxin-antitoxin system RelE/ParE family toxin [Umezawaea endophytica]|uniref:mRNA-degrading endonuclease RelE of RelBE toxin-antitoxin system n=1 Tax=Umezawaea endophytica TaxID=1654476 RepID=A0A9X2VTK7_9PSEU|nr:hypothetical protein [Umezawaea endophytica]MCS7482411.1 hypothetical protein [Umezawaea endophytica]